MVRVFNDLSQPGCTARLRILYGSKRKRIWHGKSPRLIPRKRDIGRVFKTCDQRFFVGNSDALKINTFIVPSVNENMVRRGISAGQTPQNFDKCRFDNETRYSVTSLESNAANRR